MKTKNRLSSVPVMNSILRVNNILPLYVRNIMTLYQSSISVISLYDESEENNKEIKFSSIDYYKVHEEIKLIE